MMKTSFNKSNINSHGTQVLHHFCPQILWNTDDDPDFPSSELGYCWETTILLWIPCAILFITAPFYIFSLKRRRHKAFTWTTKTYAKIIISILSCLVYVGEVSWTLTQNTRQVVLPSVTVLSGLVLFLSQILNIYLIHLGRRHREYNSPVLWTYWMLLSFFRTPQVYTSISALVHKVDWLPVATIVFFMVQYIGNIILLILSSFSDIPQDFKQQNGSKNPSPEESASFPSKLVYWWVFSMIWLGFRKPLTQDDLWDVNPDNSVKTASKWWHSEVESDDTKLKPCSKSSKENTGSANTKKTIFSLLWMMSQKKLLLSCGLFLIAEAINFSIPQFLSLLINFTTDASQPFWRGYLYATGLFCASVGHSIFRHLGQYWQSTLSVKIRTVLMDAVYQKTLTLSNSARRDSTVGQIVNHMSVDAIVVGRSILVISSIVTGPISIIVSLVFLWIRLGPSVLAGLAFIIILLPLNTFLSKKIKEVDSNTMKHKDQRVKIINEIISGIKALKMNAWENFFVKEVDAIRMKEIRLLKISAFMLSLNSFIWHVTPSMVALITFATYLLSSEENALDAETAFVSISLFNIMKAAITVIPIVLGDCIQANVSLKRLQTFMSLEDLDQSAVSRDTAKESAVSVQGGFSWDRSNSEECWSLKDIDFDLLHGKLLAVIGPVGAGKSSLMSAILGEMKKNSGDVIVNGQVAYVSQQPWLQNATLEENITWGLPFDEEKFQNIVSACSLQQDLDILPAGKHTEIGEKGINLSGGQKQRVSLARAIYANADIYLLDDPLSAVDVHVGRHIFDEVIGPKGLLRKKTRILVTHAVTFLPQMDDIIVMKDGSLLEKGNFNHLVETSPTFSQFILQHISMNQEEQGDGFVEIQDHIQGSNLLQQLSILNVDNSNIFSLDNEISGKRNSHSIVSSRQHSISEEHQDIPVKTIGMPSDFEKSIKSETIQNNINKTSESENLLGNGEASKKVDKSIQSDILLENEGNSKNGKKIPESKNILRNEIPSEDVNETENKNLLNNKSVYKNGKIIDDSNTKDIANGEVKQLGVSNSNRNIDTQKAADTVKPNDNFKQVEEEVSETGKVSRYHYCVYAKAMGSFSIIFAFIMIVLSQIFLAGGNAWLSIWSSSESDSGPEQNLQGESLGSCNGNITDCYQVPDLNDTNRLINIFSNKTFDFNRNIFLTGYCIFNLVQAFFLFTGTWLATVCSFRAANKFHQRLLNVVVHLPMSFFDTNPSGRIINRFSKDIHILDDALPDNVRGLTTHLAQILVTMGVIATAFPIALICIVPVMVLYYLVQMVAMPTSRQVRRIVSLLKSPVFSHFGESIQGAPIIRAFKKQKEFIDQSLERIEAYQKGVLTNIFVNRWLGVVLELLGSFITLATASFAVTSRDDINAGTVGLTLSYAVNITISFNILIKLAAMVETNIVSVERINDYVQREQEAAWIIDHNRPPNKWPEHGEIIFSDYQTRYRDGLDLVLHGITCVFKAGEKVGIVGRTGAGKSSLTLALFRMVESAGGSITLDGINTSKIGLHDLRSRISIIPQDPVMFSGSLRRNLDPSEVHSDGEVWEALDSSHLGEYVRTLPLKLQCHVDEGGSNFSIGQRQLACLARALLRKSQVLVMDEATAAVDLDTDDLIQETIRHQFKECTLITIAHRINTIMDSDRVLVLDQGRVAEFDSPSALLKNTDSIFYGMAKDAGLIE